MSEEKPKPPETLMDIVDEAFDLVDNRIDFLRSTRKHHTVEGYNQFEFLKDLRDLLRIKESFRDE